MFMENDVCRDSEKENSTVAPRNIEINQDAFIHEYVDVLVKQEFRAWSTI